LLGDSLSFCYDSKCNSVAFKKGLALTMMMTTTTTEPATFGFDFSATGLEAWVAQLPTMPAPLGAYIPCKQVGNLLYTSGMLPMHQGQLAYVGRVNEAVSVEEATRAAQLCVINALAGINAYLGGLSRVKSIIKVVGFVMGTADFYAQPTVINGASNLLAQVFGEAGKHARSAVGVATLPLQSPVEIELIVELTS
jgi:enamine deaminase RidA (YjgF/YER057c/UK114 family)